MDCATGQGSDTPSFVVGRPKEFTEQVSFLAEEGTHARIADRMQPGERKVDFYRAALENEIKRRSRTARGSSPDRAKTR